MEYSLPKTAHVAGREYSVRSDYRAILDLSLIHISEPTRP